MATINPTARDVNSRTYALTGNRNKFIRYFSNAECVFNAVAADGAEMESRQLTCGSQKIDIEDRDADSATIYGVDSNTFYFTATDTLGNTARKAVVATLIPYFRPHIWIDREQTTFEVDQSSDTDGILRVVGEGTWYNGNFGVKNNTLEFEYGLEENDGGITWKPVSITPSISGNTFSFSFYIYDLNYQSDYRITMNVIDELSNGQDSWYVSSRPVFEWSKEKFYHNTDIEFGKDYTNITTGADGMSIDGGMGIGVRAAGVNLSGWGYGDPDTDSATIDVTQNIDLITNNGNVNIESSNAVNVDAGDGVYINGRKFGTNKVLWSGTSHMNGNQTIYLNEAVSAQPYGIILVFSYYETSTGYANNHSWSTHFVPRYMTSVNGGGGQTFFMGINAGFSSIGAKYLVIKDTSITGHSGNTSSGANSGITFNNSEYVLRYVIGV